MTDVTPLANLLDLNNKNAIITGGGVGIGHGIARRLAEAGASVTIVDINPERAKESAEAIEQEGHTAYAARQCDVSDAESVKAMIAEVVERFGAVDILVNNAGIFPTKPVMEMSPEDFDHVLDVNLRSTFLCTHAAAAQMIKQGHGGKIINITSIDAIHPASPGLAHYDASKHGMWGFIKNVALELAPHKIWVNAIAPGGIATPGVQELQAQNPEASNVDPQKMLDEFLKQIPMHRLGNPDDIGKAALFLASDMASYMTGSQIVVDGGALLS